MIIVNNARETIIDHHQHSDQIDKFSSLYNHIIKFRSGMVEWSNYAEANYLKARMAAKFKPI